MWSAISYIPLVAGIAWFIFAWHQWGGRGQLLAVSGLMVALGASSWLFLQALRVVVPKRRPLGMSISTYSYLSFASALAMAAVLALVAFAIPLK
jgi:hypothetical protein